MGSASLLNGMICLLVILGVLEIIYIIQQQSETATAKEEAKLKLDHILLQLSTQIKDFNHSVSSLQRQDLGAGSPGVETRHIIDNENAETSRVQGSRLFPTPSALPKLKPSLGVKNERSDAGELGKKGAVDGSAKRALLFTMDSISSYEANSKKGGAAGELMIRHSLEHAFALLGVRLDVMTSDAQFLRARGDQYDFIIVDPWTWAAKGWVPKPVLQGQAHKVYVLDFFGSERLPKEKPQFKIPASRFLTAYGYPGNQFLGYYIDSREFDEARKVLGEKPKQRQGVVWGKDPRHFSGGRDRVLAQVAALVPLHSTASTPVFRHENVAWRGHQDRAGWLRLLAESKFLIGLGDPLLGPSAIDAISMGCMYINPVHDKPVRGRFKTQHDYAVEHIGAPYVCSAHLNDFTSVRRCVELALQTDLPAFIPPDFQIDAYLARVKRIFSL